MQRVIALILSLIVCLAPVFPRRGAICLRLKRAVAAAKAGRLVARCALNCIGRPAIARAPPAPERPTSGFDRDQAAAAPAAVRRVVIRRSQIPDTNRPTTWAAVTSTVAPFRLVPTAAVARTQPLRAALCIWTT
ncbi:MAG: hypothetical protein QM783_17215 [Phycisphaerales bacterium]